MGNKHDKRPNKPTPYKLEVEFFQERVLAGQSITGQAVLILDDVYTSQGGLDKAVLTIIGEERTRFCEQKKDQPKKARNRNLMTNQKQIHHAQFHIHDFQGHKTLNGGRYNLPFSIQVPREAAPSLEVSPVEMSLLEIVYMVEVAINEKVAQSKDKKAKSKSSSSASKQGTTQTLLRVAKPIQIYREHDSAPVFNKTFAKDFKNTGFSKMLSKKEFKVEAQMYSTVINPQFVNQFGIKIDNSKVSQAISGVRLSLVRNISAGIGSHEMIRVHSEEVASETSRGGPNNQLIQCTINLPTPAEIVEKHPFATEDGKTRYGSVLAPTHHGNLIQITYSYELRVWHHASFGSDSVSIMEIPVSVACAQTQINLRQAPARRNSSDQAARNQTDRFLNDMLPQSSSQVSTGSNALEMRHSHAVVANPQKMGLENQTPQPMGHQSAAASAYPQINPNLPPNPYLMQPGQFSPPAAAGAAAGMSGLAMHMAMKNQPMPGYAAPAQAGSYPGLPSSGSQVNIKPPQIAQPQPIAGGKASQSQVNIVAGQPWNEEEPNIGEAVGVGMPVLQPVNIPQPIPQAMQAEQNMPAQMLVQPSLSQVSRGSNIEPVNIAPLDLNLVIEEEKKGEDMEPQIEEPIQLQPVQELSGWQMPANMNFDPSEVAAGNLPDPNLSQQEEDGFQDHGGRDRAPTWSAGPSISEPQPQD